MLTDTLTLNSTPYVKTGSDLAKSQRSVAGLGTGIHRQLTVSKSEAKIDGVLSERFLVRFDHSKPDASGKTVPGAVYLVMQVPKDNATLGRTEVLALLADLTTLMSQTSQAQAVQILNGEL